MPKRSLIPHRTRPVSCPHQHGGWRRFERMLTDALSDLDDDEYLILAMRFGTRFVQFAGQGAEGMRVESVSNHYLDNEEALTGAERDLLLAMGWNPPTYDPEGVIAHPAEGSPPYYREHTAPVKCWSVAGLSIRTLRLVHRIETPEQLEYQAFTRAGESIRFPSLRIWRTRRTKSSDHGSEGPLALVSGAGTVH
jgi:hypothetical protein